MIPNHPETEQILLENVLFALGNPLRLSIVRRLADGEELSCNALRPEDVVKSTMTHHWRVLRDSGVIWQRPQGRENMISLRRDDLDARFPGLMAICCRLSNVHSFQAIDRDLPGCFGQRIEHLGVGGHNPHPCFT